ncbi:MAG: hypothetical protein A2589_03585 [Candidatus Vogelbacteria bacterium RIFOXYD1_FULL_46_19]|uniref:TGS domain-containing protein n=1 Tax=Candidatus Vogelbacteria bacterium RIFOXYD1_FULL_46_19 TaxID=1802439 RepID=A0A1G2QF68_9BACT|nr:MAG: hypothetical protein A2589_03585 [Candidatus Vogelbacteria bacterium RIFOXYD1_FULL_46_19]
MFKLFTKELDPQEIFDLMNSPTEEDKEKITHGLEFAKKAHADQLRFSGEPYVTHPFEVAKILAGLKATPDMIVAGLIHDTLEDTPITEADIEVAFGPNILFLVEGVTKLGKIKYRGLERHVESLRKLFFAMAEDIRVVIIKLADRLHNVRTLQYVRADKRERIALETIQIYAPIANRLGIWRLKGQLEDASFPFAHPAEFESVTRMRKTKGKESLKRIQKFSRNIQTALADAGLRHATIDYRIKYLYGLYKKLMRKNMDIDQIYDILALRVIVNTIPECYQVLGIVHGLYRPMPGRLNDYIAHPKPNGYQSIHTDVFSPDGTIAEIQIRTQKMHEESQYGIASHIIYTESNKPKQGGILRPKLNWIKNLIDWQKQTEGSEEFLTTLKTDFFEDQIFTFTPKGDVIELPVGATVIDFAYAIHSDLGNHASGGRINGKFSSLNTKLQNRDCVEIETKKSNRPTQKWLEFAKTSLAKRHIRSFLQKVDES